MGYAELIEQLQALPPERQAEVFDFVEFLSRRSVATRAPHARADWADAEFTGLAMAQALRDIEDDTVVYSTADLRERWQ